MRGREEPGAALEGAHAAAQKGGGEGDVARLVDGGEVAVVARRSVDVQGDVEDLRKAADARLDAGVAQGVAEPVHQPAAAAFEIGEDDGIGELLQGGDGRRHGDRLRVVGAAMDDAASGEEVEQIGPPGERGDGKAVGDRLAEGGKVGGDAETLLRAAGGKTEAGDDLVKEEDRAV